MSNPHIHLVHKAGIRVLKAISASIRIQILNLLQEKGSMSYSELMSSLKLDTTRDAGRFAYHLKSLLKADLIEPDVETRKYHLTDLGRHIIRVTDDIEDRTYKRRKMLVRTSRFSIEEFDRNKITKSLVKEANVPTDLAQKIARETEKRLQRFQIKYVTAPLIREIVNTILLEKHYEDFRHNLTRLGLPVQEVTSLIKTSEQNVDTIQKAAGNAVIEEYTLLKILPREISDAYLSGSLYLNNLATWILKPNEIIHSLPFFLRIHKPKTFEATLNLITNVIRNTSIEINGYQSFENINIHLAPFIKNLPINRIQELLRLFIKSLSQTPQEPTTLTLELAENQHPDVTNLTMQLLKALDEENKINPLRNPKIVIKLRQQLSKATEVGPVLLKAHEIALKSTLIYFANLNPTDQRNATYIASGLRMNDDWLHDKELDIQRTGNLDTVTINLPRISFESKGNVERFLEQLGLQLKRASQALDIKFKAIKKRIIQNQLSYLAQKFNDDQYFRLNNTSRTISLMGLLDAVEEMMVSQGNDPKDNGKISDLTERILKFAYSYTKEQSKKPEIRLSLAIIKNRVAAFRLAKLDVEKYGWGVVRTHGSKNNPYYINVNEVSFTKREQILLEERIHQLTPGGHLALISPFNQDVSAEAILSQTKQIARGNIRFYVYNIPSMYCYSCRSSNFGIHKKCPNCESTNIFTMTFC